MPIQKTHLSALGTAAIMACALSAIAQVPDPNFEPTLNFQVDKALPGRVLLNDVGTRIENRYRLGIGCAPVPEALRVHLRLQDDAGLLVNAVLDESPGGRAGIKRHDVIVAANGQPLTSVEDLVAAVNEAKDTEMSLAIIHAGEEQTVKLTPEERDEEEIERLRNGFANRLGRNQFMQGFDMGDMEAEIERAIEQMQKQLGPMQNGFRMQMGPGIVFGPNGIPSAGNTGGWSSSKSTITRSFQSNGEEVSVTIARDDNGPAKIKVKRGSESWSLTEKELDQLPKDIRGLVESQLNGRGTLRGLMAPGFPAIPSRPRVPAKPRNNKQQIDDRFDGVELQLRELQDAINSIQEK